MYQNCCKKCGSIALHTEVKGNNTGLYCNDCGAIMIMDEKDITKTDKNDDRPQCCKDHDKYFSTCDTCEFGE